MNEEPKSKTLSVEGIVAARDKKPYVTLYLDEDRIAQLDVAAARTVAMDILTMCSRVEADAIVIRFFEKNEFPQSALGAVMLDFREFRAELDAEPVEHSTHENLADQETPL